MADVTPKPRAAPPPVSNRASASTSPLSASFCGLTCLHDRRISPPRAPSRSILDTRETPRVTTFASCSIPTRSSVSRCRPRTHAHCCISQRTSRSTSGLLRCRRMHRAPRPRSSLPQPSAKRRARPMTTALRTCCSGSERTHSPSACGPRSPGSRTASFVRRTTPMGSRSMTESTAGPPRKRPGSIRTSNATSKPSVIICTGDTGL